MTYSTADVMGRFAAWWEEAKARLGVEEATAACLATADGKGRPSARIVLVKEADAGGFLFFTNYNSRKGCELAQNPQAALCFYWEPLGRQVRVEGRVEHASATQSDAYFATRHPESRLGAWASAQSEPLESREALLKRLETVKRQYAGEAIPRPPHWGGFRLVPERIEFWQEGEYRLHDRDLFIRRGDGWEMQKLGP